MALWSFINTSFIEESRASLPINDLAIQRGYGVFDFLKLAGNKPLFLQDHLDRFHASAKALHLPVEMERRVLVDVIDELIKRNDIPGSGMRLTLTGGATGDGLRISRPNLIISQHLFQKPTPLHLEKGLRLMSYGHQRQLPQVKSIDYLMAVWLQPFLEDKGFDDVLYFAGDFATECPRANFFLIGSDNKIITPASQVLMGITRKKTIGLAQNEFGYVVPQALLLPVPPGESTLLHALMRSRSRRIIRSF
jgi:branched-chain amino acid aminotransferase